MKILHQPEETIDGYITEFRNLLSTCDFQDIRDGLMLYRMVDGIESNQVRDVADRRYQISTQRKLLRYADQMK